MANQRKSGEVRMPQQSPPQPPPGMPALPPPMFVPQTLKIPNSPLIIQHPGLPPLESRMAELKAAGLRDSEVRRQMLSEGYSSQDLLTYFQTQQFAPTQSPTDMPLPTMQGMPMALPPPPPPPRYEQEGRKEDVITLLTEDIQEISEAIIAEKWGQAKKEIETMSRWREDAESKITGMQDQLKALEAKMDSLEKAIFGKVEQYSRGISDVNAELKAMQRVFSTVMPTFTANIKELQGLVEEKKKSKR